VETEHLLHALADHATARETLALPGHRNRSIAALPKSPRSPTYLSRIE